ncbi:ependymin [Carassius gibelio]|uniref:ependymin n=1 Tax=Carassius gibelio TaxID=101364 RepID=UPI0022774E86|nr:ependymin [Carassius gibelio]
MKTLLALCSVLLLTGRCSAQTPQKCQTPRLLSGSISLSTQDGQVWAVAKYIYDALGQRIRLWETGHVQNKSFYVDLLFLFKKGVVYTIDDRNQTCQKNPLSDQFHPFHIPHNASLQSQVILGGSSSRKEGLLVNTWKGDVPEIGGKYLATVTEFGCFPVSMLYYSARTGWIATTYFNAVKGIGDPEQLNPPPFCPAAETEDQKLDFFSAFF